MKPILKTVFSYIRYYKKQTVTILLSVILSTMLLSGISSLVYSGTQSQLENNRKIFGDWHYYFDTDNNITENVQTHMTGTGYNITNVGIMEKREIIEEPYVISMLYGDENYLEMMGLSFKKGGYPEKKDEIALDEYTLHNILPDGILGSKVRLDGTLYSITGILSKASIIEETEMRTFVYAGRTEGVYSGRAVSNRRYEAK